MSSRAWHVALPIVVGCALRLSVVVAFPDMPLHGDEVDFVRGSHELLAGEDVSIFPFRPPLYIWMGAAVYGVFGDSNDVFRVIQILIEGLAMAGVYLVGRRAIGRRTGIVAAWLYALSPDFIVYSHYLWSESIALVLLIFGLERMLAMRERPAWGGAVVLGLLWGMLCLVKPFALYMLPLLLAWVVWRSAFDARGATLRVAGLAIALCAAVITPWSVHQSLRTGKTVLVCTTGPWNLRTGVDYAPPPQYDLASDWDLTPEERASYPVREEGVVSFILHNPGLFLGRAFVKMSYLWSPNSYLLRYFYTYFPPRRTFKYGSPYKMDPTWRRATVWTSLGGNMLLVVGLLVGIFLTRERELFGLTVIFCVTYMAMITLTPALSRYRLPLMVFAVLWSAATVTGGIDVKNLEARPRMVGGMFASLALMAVLWSLRLPDILQIVQ